jgi:hypothetical protein
MITIMGIIAISILVLICCGILYVVVLGIANTSLEWINKAIHYWLEIKSKAQQIKLNSISRLMPDENTRQGVVYDGSNFRNLDSGERFTMLEEKYLDPLMWKVDKVQQTLLAMKGVNFPQEQIQELIAPKAANLLPSRVTFEDAIQGQRISLDNLVLGVTLEDCDVRPVTRSLHDLLHLLNIGQTGAGKSNWSLSFLAQIEMCEEPIDVYLIDVHGSAFNVLSDWGKLKYPIARTNDQARLILEKVRIESERRMHLYEQVPLADDLCSYNQNTEGETLVPWLVVIDEGTLMLADRAISKYVAAAAQGTRQYGLYVFMSGQTAKANVISTPIRDNFPTRLCFNNEDSSVRVTLGGSPPGELEEIPGRGWIRLKGKKTPLKIQAPIINRSTLYKMIKKSGPKEDFPVIEGECETLLIPEEEQVMALHRSGYSNRQIEIQVYGHAGGDAFEKVKRVLDGT